MYPSYGNMPMPERRCQRCGTPLVPQEVYCRTCGQYNAPAPTNSFTEREVPPAGGMSWGASTPQTSYGAGQYGNSQWGQPPTSPPQNGPYMGPSPFQQASNPNNFYTTNNPPSNPNGYFAAQTQTAYAPSSFNTFQPGTGIGFPPTGYDQPPEQKRGPRVGLIIGITLLLLLLLGAAAGGYLYLKKQNPASKTTNTTVPTVKTTGVPSGTPLFSDTFNDNAKGWDLTGTPGKVSVNLGGGSLTLDDNENTLFPEFIPGKTFDNFQLRVDAKLSKGDQNNGYGVYIRIASTQNTGIGTYYRFEIYGDGTYAVFKGTVDASGNSNSNKLVDFTANPAIQKQGKFNSITITALGSSMSFIVNGTTLTKITDSSYKSGSAALFVSNVKDVQAGAEAVFSHLVIYP